MILPSALATLLSATAIAGAQTANHIVPDGRTATSLQVNGAVTTVTTGTISGPNAFNSFSHFQVGIGNTANLVLPAGTVNLINVVRDGPTVVHGIVNSYADGEIGGNVYFASPHGFVVGAAGTVNVGSLSVTATDHDFAERLIGAGGSIDHAAVATLLAGAAPLSPDGAIYIRGRVNARDGISLRAKTVAVGDDAGANSTIAPMTQEETFAATVNASGVRRGAGLVSRGGKISIVAAGDARLGGRVRANGKAGKKAGGVEVRAGRDIEVDPTARISAAGRGAASSGGDIVIFADRNLSVASGAVFDAGAGSSGDGGFIELSAAKTVSLAGEVSLLARAGAGGVAGTVLIDPADVVIGEAGGATQASIRSDGANIEIVASNSITIQAGGYINTRVTATGGNDVAGTSAGNSGDITLKAPEINVHGALIAHADGVWSAGNVTLEAIAEDARTSGRAVAEASIEVTGTITGGDIQITASATAISEYENVYNCADVTGVGCMDGLTAPDLAFFFPELDDMPGWTLEDLAAGNIDGIDPAATVGSFWTLLAPLVEMPLTGLVAAEARSSIEIASSAVIEAAGDLTISSTSVATASTTGYDMDVIADSDTLPNAAPPLVFAWLRSEADTIIRAGATVGSGGALEVSAANEATLDAHSIGSTYSPSLPDASDPADAFRVATITFSWAEVDSNAVIEAGANITAGELTLSAVNENSFVTRAAVFTSDDDDGGDDGAEPGGEPGGGESGNGAFGLALAIAAKQSSIANALLAANVNATDGDVRVEAQSLTSSNVTSTETYVGERDGFLGQLAAQLNTAATNADLMQNAEASAAGVYNLGRVVNSAVPEGKEDEPQPGGGGGGSWAQPGLGSSVALTLGHDHRAMARISATEVQAAGEVAVVANVLDAGIRSMAVSEVTSLTDSRLTMSAALAFAEYNHEADASIAANSNVTADSIAVEASAVVPITVTWHEWEGIGTLGSRLNSSTGLGGTVMSSYVTATSDNDADGLAFAGAISYFGVSNAARARIEDGAVLTATGGDIAVRSESVAEAILLGGNIDFDNLGNAGGKAQVGGSFVFLNYDNVSEATVGAAVLDAAGAVTVTAEGDDKAFVVAPSAGYGAAYAGAGMLALTLVDTTTRATLSNAANVDAAAVDVHADQALAVVTVAGAVQQAEKANIGAALALSIVETDTKAVIGPTAGGHPTGRIRAGAVDVTAQTYGQVATLGVAASLTADTSGGTGEPGEPGGGAGEPGGGTGEPGGGGTGSGGMGLPTGDIFPMLREVGTQDEENGPGVLPENWSDIVDVLEIAYEIYGKIGEIAGQAQGNAGASSTEGTAAPAQQVDTTPRGAAAGSSPIAGGSAATGASASSAQGSEGTFGFGLSGSIAAGVTMLDTYAGIQGANIERPSTADPEDDALRVLALRNVFNFNLAGAAALVSAGQFDSNASAAVAGSLALNLSMGETLAEVAGSSVTGFEAARVEAISAGTIMVVAMDLALNATVGDPRQGVSVALVGSATIAESLDRTAARVTGSTITGSGAADAALSVIAYDRMYTAIGGGAIKVHASTQAGASAGVAFTYSGRHDPASGATVEALIEDSLVTGVADVTVAAHVATRTLAAAAMLSRGALDAAAAGSAVVTDYGQTVRSAIIGSDLALHRVEAAGDVTVRTTGDVALDGLLSADLSLLGRPQVRDIHGDAQDDPNNPDFSFGSLADALGSADDAIAVADAGIQDALDDILPPGLAVLSVAGALGNQSIGLSFVFSGGHIDMLSEVAGVTVQAGGNFTVSADTEATLVNLAIAGSAFGNGLSASGAVTVNMLDGSAVARLGDDGPATSVAAGAVDVSSSDASRIWTLAMGLAASNGGNAFSAGVTYAGIGNRTVAEVANAGIRVDGALTVAAASQAQIISVATGVSGGSNAFAGSASVNIISNDIAATIGRSGAAVTVAAGDVAVSADDDSEIWSLAGSGGFGQSGGAGGAAVAFNQIANDTHAAITDADLAALHTLTVAAGSDASIRTAAIAGALGSQWALAGSVTVSLIANTIEAVLAGSTVNDGAFLATLGDPDFVTGLPTALVVRAHDGSSIWSLAGGIGGGGGASAGAGIAFNSIGNDVAAVISGGDANVGSALLKAASGADIRTVGIGVAIGSFGAAGSVATNLVETRVRSLIRDGASVDATGNIGVIASNTDAVSVIAGAAGVGATGAGIGLSIVVNVLEDEVEAAIRGAGTLVDARGLDLDDALTVASGALVDRPDTGGVLEPEALAPALTLATEQVRGLAVVATSTQSVVTNAATIGLGQVVAAAVTPVVNVMGGSTVAEVVDAGVGTRLTADPAGAFLAPDLKVTAASHAYSGNFVVNAALSVGLSASASAVAVTSDRTTRAQIRDAEVGSAGIREDVEYRFSDGPGGGEVTVDSIVTRRLLPRLGAVSVNAQATQSTAGIAVGLGAGLVGTTGNFMLTLIDADTGAQVSGGRVTAESLSVGADSFSGSSALVGSFAGGLSGAAGALSVTVNESRTTAFVGDPGNAGAALELRLTGDLDVAATSGMEIGAVAATGTLAVGVAAAAMANVVVASAETLAGVHGVILAPDAAVQSTGVTTLPVDVADEDLAGNDGDGDVTYIAGTATITDYAANGSVGAPAGAVRVSAGETVDIELDSGAAAAGLLGGVGAGVNLVIFNGTVGATIRDSHIEAAGEVAVTADSARVVDAAAFAGGAAVLGGVGAAVGVVLVGSDLAGDGLAGLNHGGPGSTGEFDAIAGQGRLGADNPSLSAGARDAVNGRTSYGVAGAVSAPPADAVSATVAASTISADSLAVDAEARLSTSNQVSAAGIGAAVGIGGAVAYSAVNTVVEASALGSDIGAADIAVTASMADAGAGPAALAQAYAGGGGGWALGAGSATALVSNNVSALASGVFAGSADFVIEASDDAQARAEAIGGAIGLNAVGAMVAVAERESDVAAELAAASTVDGFAFVGVEAVSAGGASAYSLGASGGVLAGSASVAIASDDSSVTALVGDGVAISGVSEGVAVIAEGAPRASATAHGASVGAAAVGASVAEARARPTILAGIGDDVRVSGSGGLALTAIQNGAARNAAAEATVGAGGLLIGASAAVATASNDGSVKALAGDRIVLPNGDVLIAASNVTWQEAEATGVTIGGLAAAGAVFAEASSGDAADPSQTLAVLGHGARGVAGRSGNVSVTSTGIDKNQASATAGTGAAIAGNAAVARTGNHAEVTAELSGDTELTVGALTVLAFHENRFGQAADSVNAAIVGASGADGRHSSTTTTRTTLGDDIDIVSAGNIVISAEQLVVQDQLGGASDTARAAGGGVINGASAYGRADIVTAADVTLGERNRLTAGLHPEDMPGNIFVVAGTQVYTSMQSTLETGGVFQGAGGEIEQFVTASNRVATGDHSALASVNNVGLGTYARLYPSSTSLVKTWGLAGVGDAEARTEVTADQTVLVGSDSVIEALGNVDVTAGSDPTGSYSTQVEALALAQSYVTGLIAIPDASARGVADSDASTTISADTMIRSGQNTVLGAYNGPATTTVEGAAKGYQLGFIPVSEYDSDSTVRGSTAVTMHGTAIAGAWANLEIEIPDCADDGIFCSQPTQNAGWPVAMSYRGDFLPSAFTALSGLGESDRQFLADGMATSPVGAVFLGDMFASGGTVTIHGDTIAGAGSVTANGGPSITVANHSPNYLVLGRMIIPQIPGGEVLFTGRAGRQQAEAAGLSATEVNAGATPFINVRNFHDGAVGDVTFGPGMFLTGEVRNLGGQINIVNDAGSIAQFDALNGQIVNVEAPTGVLLMSKPDGALHLPGNPYSDWNSFMIMPGGNPANGKPNADWGVVYLANAVYNANGQYTTNQAFSRRLMNRIGDDQPNNYSILFFGSCVTHDGCSVKEAQAASPIRENFGMGHDIMRQPMVPVMTLTKQTDASKSVSEQYAQAGIVETPSLINAQRVRIAAQYVDIKGLISAGQASDWSVVLPAALAAKIDAFRAAYAADASRTEFDLGLLSVSNTINPLDSLINAVYDAASDQIVLDRVTAGAAGASVVIEGGIVSTTPFGNIRINAGLGDVRIVNETGVSVRVADINAGSASLITGLESRVEIIDTLKSSDNHWRYVYNPGAGLNVYRVDGGVETLVSSSSDDFTSTYDPQQGLRWEWALQADLQREITYVGGNTRVTDTNWNWVFPAGSPNDPWRYVDADGNLTTTPTGRLLTGQDSSLPVFQQRISGGIPNISSPSGAPSPAPDNLDWQNDWWVDDANGVTGFTRYYIRYHGCDDGECHYGFAQTHEYGENGFRDHDDHETTGLWHYYFIERGRLTSTQSVKADNPIGISFAGKADGVVQITSNGQVRLTGQINNADGQTGIAVTGAGNSIEASLQSKITSAAIELGAEGAIGSAASPVNIALTRDGALTATGDAGVFVNVNGTARLQSVAAVDGNVAIRADGSILAADGAGTAVLGNDVSLSSRFGAVGDATAPLVVQSNRSLDVFANTGIAVVQPHGDMAVKQAVAATGAVSLTAQAGAILDHAGTTASSVLSEAQVDAIWRHLRMTAAYGSEAGAEETTVAPLEAKVNAAYRQYWNYLSLGSEVDGVFVVDPSKAALFVAVAGAGYEAYADAQFQEMKRTFAELVGEDWRSAAPFQTHDAGFVFRIDAGRAAELVDGATWTVNQLTTSIIQSALRPGEGTPVGSTSPNVAGETLALHGYNGVGALAPSVSIAIDDLRAGTLTQVERAALALATTPGDVLLYGVVDGVEVAFALGDEPDGVELTRVEVMQTAPLFVDSEGRIDAYAQFNGVYLQAVVGDLLVGAVEAANGDVSLTAPGSVLRADGDGSVVTGNALRVLAGDGDIGAADRALVVDVDELAAIVADGDIRLQAVGGDTGVGLVYAGGLADLDATRGGLFGTGTGASVEADTIRLRTEADAGLGTSGDIGSAATPFVVRHGAGGRLDGAAAGSAFVSTSGPLFSIGTFTATDVLAVVAEQDLATENLTAGGAVDVAAIGAATLRTVTAGDSINVLTGGIIGLSGDVTASSGASFAGAALAMATASTLTAGSAVAVDVTGDAALGAVTAGTGLNVLAGGTITLGGSTRAGGVASFTGASLAMDAGVSLVTGGRATGVFDGTASVGRIESRFDGLRAIDLTAAEIMSNGDGQANMVARGASAGVHLLATAGDIGASSRYLRVDTPRIAPSAPLGSIYIHGLSSFTLADTFAPAGSVHVLSDGDLSFGLVESHDVIDLEAAGSLTGGTAIGDAVRLVANGGPLVVDLVQAMTAELGSRSLIQAPDIRVFSALTLAGGDIRVGVSQIEATPPATTPQLVLNVSGWKGGHAGSFDFDIAAPGGFLLATFNVANATLRSTTPAFRLDNATITGRLFIETSLQRLLVDNTGLMPMAGVHTQLFQPTGPLFLAMDGMSLLTNAFVVAFQAGVRATVVNYNAPHIEYGPHMVGSSVLRDAWRNYLMGNDDILFQEGTAPAWLTLFAPAQGESASSLFVESPGERPAVNLD